MKNIDIPYSFTIYLYVCYVIGFTVNFIVLELFSILMDVLIGKTLNVTRLDTLLKKGLCQIRCPFSEINRRRREVNQMT